MTYEDVQRMEGTFTGANENVIGILVARSKKNFTAPARNRAKVARSSGYKIILTDENNLYSDLIGFIVSIIRLDGSNNNGGREMREEERREMEERVGLVHKQIRYTADRGEYEKIKEELAGQKNVIINCATYDYLSNSKCCIILYIYHIIA